MSLAFQIKVTGSIWLFELYKLRRLYSYNNIFSNKQIIIVTPFFSFKLYFVAQISE